MRIEGSKWQRPGDGRAPAAEERDMSIRLRISVKLSEAEIEEIKVVDRLSSGKGCNEDVLRTDVRVYVGTRMNLFQSRYLGQFQNVSNGIICRSAHQLLC